MKVEQLTISEQSLVMYAIRQFGKGGHPMPDKKNVIFFTPQYASQCLRRVLKGAILNAPEREKITDVVRKLHK